MFIYVINTMAISIISIIITKEVRDKRVLPTSRATFKTSRSNGVNLIHEDNRWSMFSEI